MEIFAMEFWVALGSIIILDLVLGGDNAVVIAMASRNLAAEKRKKAIYIGTMGAIIIRTLMTFLAVWVLTIPYLQALGGLALLPIAVNLLKPNKCQKEVTTCEGFWSAIKTIIIADVAMGIDNVLAIAGAADGHFGLVVIGLLISVPIIVWGSQLIGELMKKYPSLILIGSAILVWTGSGMIIHDPMVAQLLNSIMQSELLFFIPLVLTSAIIIYGYYAQKKCTVAIN
ncbi:MAG TPA: TerC family protein [Candidatus Avacidaminococcus intestinavium]|uniref:TerC family protein n=1 Tax=Candidatus Avacidaminococcus intestinavium TaxID=2840684 RepID=A0A9D1MP26_9FIRM|nr:TerC family protein [Candidatus Avacidaminococcus intestinavium]